MAFRGIQSDEALREKQTRQELNLVAQDFINLFSHTLDYPDSLSRFTDFLIEQKETITIIQDRLLFLPDKYLDNTAPDRLFSLPDEGWEREFITNNYETALRFHQTILDSNPGSGKTISSLLAVARLYRKMGDSRKSLAIYDTLMKNYSDHKIGDIPIRLSALKEKYEIFRDLKDTVNVQRTNNEIVEELLQPRVNYNQHTFELFAGDISFDFKSHIKRSTYLNQLLLNIDNYLHSPADQSFYLTQNGFRDLIIIRIHLDGTSHGRLIDLNDFFEEMFGQMLSNIDRGNQYGWQIKHEKGNTIINQNVDDQAQAFGFPMAYPVSGWNIELHVPVRNTFTAFISSGRAMYVTLFVLISIWLILGLFFTVYLLSQEIRLSRLKSRFISNVTHEFKSPVTSIQHMSELLKLRRVRTEEKKVEFYDSMIEQCEHLNHLIENVLDFSKMEEKVKAYQLEMTPITPLLTGMVGTQKDRLSESGIELDLHVLTQDLGISVDKDAIRQVVYNLLDNAQKFGSTIIMIKANQIIDIPPQLEISISDNGMGISKRDLPYIFDRFYRGEVKKTEGIKGSGIGLTIVKRIIEAHGGSISVESEEGAGTKFLIKLPVNQINHA